jgi:signal transduction histidine kinase
MSAVFASVAVLWISGAVIRPVRALVAGSEAIARGDLEHRVRHARADEFAVVADSFNRMAATLAATRESLLEKNKRLEEAYRMQSEFVSVVTHELRSPLHSIRGYLEFIEEDEPSLSAQSKRNLHNIDEGAKRLLRLVNDILDFSKLEAHQLQITCSRFALGPILDEALHDARALLQARPVELVLEAPQGDLFLHTDYTRLRQILTNLLTNAIKFTERGQVTLTVEVRGEQVELIVRDTGIGMDAAQLGIIFQPFRQATRAGEQAFGGTGLGLAIVARLAELIHATISVQSEPGRGSEFRLLLPKEASRTQLLAG